jgi:hypothetical protein
MIEHPERRRVLLSTRQFALRDEQARALKAEGYRAR